MVLRRRCESSCHKEYTYAKELENSLIQFKSVLIELVSYRVELESTLIELDTALCVLN